MVSHGFGKSLNKVNWAALYFDNSMKYIQDYLGCDNSMDHENTSSIKVSALTHLFTLCSLTLDIKQTVRNRIISSTAGIAIAGKSFITSKYLHLPYICKKIVRFKEAYKEIIISS
jgi:hypothetical protein